MASIRHHRRTTATPDEVWALVTDFGGLADWFPGVDACTIDGGVRTVTTMGMDIEEKQITNDGELRRLQYSIVGGPMVPAHHLATIDVLDDGDGALIVYSCDVAPDELAEVFDGVYASAAQGIADHFNG